MILAMDSPGEPALFLIVRLENRCFAVPTVDIERVVRMPALTLLPGAQAPVVGAVIVEGTALPVVDPRPLLNLATPDIDGDQHLLITSTRERFAIWVDRAERAEFVGAEDLEPAPAQRSPSATPFLAHLSQDCVAVLNTLALAPRPATPRTRSSGRRK
jgi:chemotaxis signal transduction protein